MIYQKLDELKKRISRVCKRLGINPQDIKLITITKSATIEMIKEAIDCGVENIGENRVQDGLLKYNAMRNTCFAGRQAPYAGRIKWHMVGHLQTNKVREAVEIFDLIQSVDSLKIALEIDSQASKIGKIQDILVQVNTSNEATKFGLKPEEAGEVIFKIANLKNINVLGLMTIAPLVDNPEKTRPYFRRLRELKDEICKLQSANCNLQTLSMGMTDDFEVAIEEGSNMIRIGRAIFERG